MMLVDMWRTKQHLPVGESATASRWPWSPGAWVMFSPTAGYQALAGRPADQGRWSALRRPLFVAFLLGCMVSLATSQCLTLRHVAGGAVSATFLLLGQIAALALVCHGQRRLSFSRVVDLFFMGYGPWSLWILCFSAAWAFVPPADAFAWVGMGAILPTAAAAAIWSCYIDFCFFRRVLQRTPAGAAWDLVRLWVITWSLSIVIFGGGPLWSEHMRMLGR
jgi:hypothetical protein